MLRARSGIRRGPRDRGRGLLAAALLVVAAGGGAARGEPVARDAEGGASMDGALLRSTRSNALFPRTTLAAALPQRQAGVLTVPAAPQPTKPTPVRFEANFRRPTDYLWILLGAATGFVVHESGHILFDYAFGRPPTFVGVKLGPFPFFAIQPTGVRTPQERYVIASAGFLMQDLWSELILGFMPRLREHDHPLLKGMLGFHIVLSLGYAITGFAGIGPPQSDVNSMAAGLGVPPWAIGAMLTVPALCDLYRYLVPGSRWAPYVSAASKLTTVGVGFAF